MCSRQLVLTTKRISFLNQSDALWGKGELLGYPGVPSRYPRSRSVSGRIATEHGIRLFGAVLSGQRAFIYASVCRMGKITVFPITG